VLGFPVSDQKEKHREKGEEFFALGWALPYVKGLFTVLGRTVGIKSYGMLWN
jgi:hypothetical protein